MMENAVYKYLKKECYTEADGSDYTGDINKTKSGVQCANFEGTKGWNPSVPDETGFCRNNDNDTDTAWCYTKGDKKAAAYCDIGAPEKSCNDEVIKLRAKSYITEWKNDKELAIAAEALSAAEETAEAAEETAEAAATQHKDDLNAQKDQYIAKITDYTQLLDKVDPTLPKFKMFKIIKVPKINEHKLLIAKEKVTQKTAPDAEMAVKNLEDLEEKYTYIYDSKSSYIFKTIEDYATYKKEIGKKNSHIDYYINKEFLKAELAKKAANKTEAEIAKEIAEEKIAEEEKEKKEKEEIKEITLYVGCVMIGIPVLIMIVFMATKIRISPTYLKIIGTVVWILLGAMMLLISKSNYIL